MNPKKPRRARTPAPRVPLEEAEQKALASWLNARGNILWTHVANERKAKPQYMRKLAALGVSAGVPDVLIFSRVPNHPHARGVAIELKRTKGSTTSAAQKSWVINLNDEGWIAMVCKGAAASIEELQRLGF